MANRERPLSPHIQVYRWQITLTMSILHRTTGIILVVGAFALAWWLLAVAAGGDVYATAAACLASPLGMIALFGRSAKHASELQSLMRITYSVYCFNKQTNNNTY